MHLRSFAIAGTVLCTLAACADQGDEPELRIAPPSADGSLHATVPVGAEVVSIDAEDAPLEAGDAEEGSADDADGKPARPDAQPRFKLFTIKGSDGEVYASWKATDDAHGDAISGTIGGRTFGDPDHADEESDPETWRPIAASRVGTVLETVSHAAQRTTAASSLRNELAAIGDIHEFLKNLAAFAPPTTGSVGTTTQAASGFGGHVWSNVQGLLGAIHYEGEVHGSGRVCISMYQGTVKTVNGKDAYDKTKYTSTIHCGNRKATVDTKHRHSCAKAFISNSKTAKWTSTLCVVLSKE